MPEKKFSQTSTGASHQESIEAFNMLDQKVTDFIAKEQKKEDSRAKNNSTEAKKIGVKFETDTFHTGKNNRIRIQRVITYIARS